MATVGSEQGPGLGACLVAGLGGPGPLLLGLICVRVWQGADASNEGGSETLLATPSQRV